MFFSENRYPHFRNMRVRFRIRYGRCAGGGAARAEGGGGTE
jgi:hypothetical protein